MVSSADEQWTGCQSCQSAHAEHRPLIQPVVNIHISIEPVWFQDNQHLRIYTEIIHENIHGQQKSGIIKFKCFWKKSVLLTKAEFIWSKHIKKSYCEILLEFKIIVFYLNIFPINLMLWCKAGFSVQYSFRNHSNMLIWCSRFLINVGKSYAA